MELREAVNEYITHLGKSGRSENTIRSASQALRVFDAQWDSYPVDRLERRHLEAVFETYRSLAPASYNRYRSALVSFFDYCVAHGYVGTNPARLLPTRKVIDKPHLILTPEQMLEMLDGANPVERIALAIGMNTALRASDVVALKVGDIDLESLTLRTKIQKTGGYDEKPITNQLAAELDGWLWEYANNLGYYSPAGLPDEHLLIPSYQWTLGLRKPLSGEIPELPPMLQGWKNEFEVPGQILVIHPNQPITHPHRLVQRALERLGLPTEGEGFHTLRRSSARALFEKLREEGGYDHALMVVREFLNHRSVEQTQRYLGVSHERQIRDATLRGRDFLVRKPVVPPPNPLLAATGSAIDRGESEEPPPFDIGPAVAEYLADHNNPLTIPVLQKVVCAEYYNSAGVKLADNIIDINRNHNRSYANPERIY